jgi:N-acetylmuramoyl-L-alanine amidase
MLKDPPRVVLDLDAVDMSPELQKLPALVAASDPYIARIRFGRQPQDVLRLVVDLREDVKTELFTLPPVAIFGHRVVLDLYPLTPIDPLMALLRDEPRRADGGRTDTRRRAGKPARAHRQEEAGNRRRITIAIDPGHGGEDPGAIGPPRHAGEGRRARHRAQAEGD